MALRISVALALVLTPPASALAHQVPSPAIVLMADRDSGPMTGKERQKACTEQWRKFSAAEKTAQGPSWPQFYTRCVKRLKARTA